MTSPFYRRALDTVASTTTQEIERGIPDDRETLLYAL